MTEKKLFTFENCLIVFFIFSFLLTPPLHIPLFYFSFQITDFLFPFAVISIIKNKWYKEDNLKVIIFFIAVSVYIFFGILINGQIRVINGYFEIYKVIKIGAFFILFGQQTNFQLIKSTLAVTFICLLIFNILHYYNVFNFNEIVMPIYCGSDNLNLVFFGYDSLGNPATKRMIGTIGNPNNNALIFLLFLILYAPREKWSRKNIVFFFLALIAFIMCQSRTGIIAFICMMIANYIFSKIHWKKILLQSSCIIAMIVLVMNSYVILSFFNINLRGDSSLYIRSLFNADAFRSNSMKERIRVWTMLLGEAKKKPLFGHSPDKNYFYNNGIHVDNEYVAVIYKYGIIGLIVYLMIFIAPSLYSFRLARSSLAAKNIILIAVAGMVTALTNYVFFQSQISLFICLLVAMSIHIFRKEGVEA